MCVMKILIKMAKLTWQETANGLEVRSPNLKWALMHLPIIRDFDFTMFWTARYGNKIFNGQRQTLEAMDAPNNMPSDLKPWTAEHPSNTTPRPLFGPNDNVMFQSDRWLEDGSFLTLKTLQFGYNLSSVTDHKNEVSERLTHIYQRAEPCDHYQITRATIPNLPVTGYLSRAATGDNILPYAPI